MRTVLKPVLLLVMAGSCLAGPPARETVRSLAPPIADPPTKDARTVLHFVSDTGRRRFLSEHNAALLRLSALIAGSKRQQGPDTLRLKQSTAVMLTDGEQRAEVQQRLEELDVMLAKELSAFADETHSNVLTEDQPQSTADFRLRLAKYAAVGAKCDDCHTRYTVVPR